MRKKVKIINCECCGKEFLQPRKESRFCSSKCSQNFLWQNIEYKEKQKKSHLGQKAWNKGIKGICKPNKTSVGVVI